MINRMILCYNKKAKKDERSFHMNFKLPVTIKREP